MTFRRNISWVIDLKILIRTDIGDKSFDHVNVFLNSEIKTSISTLIDIERQNLTELFAEKIALEKAQLQKSAEDEPEAKYDPEIILLNSR